MNPNSVTFYCTHFLQLVSTNMTFASLSDNLVRMTQFKMLFSIVFDASFWSSLGNIASSRHYSHPYSISCFFFRLFIFVLSVFYLFLSFLISWLFSMSPLLSFFIPFACISRRVNRNKTERCACLIIEREPFSSVSIVTRIWRGLPPTLRRIPEVG
jgi:hypothetical protein